MVEAGLEVHQPSGRMEPWSLHGIAGAQALVEHAGDDLDERTPEPRPSGCARRKR